MYLILVFYWLTSAFSMYDVRMIKSVYAYFIISYSAAVLYTIKQLQ